MAGRPSTLSATVKTFSGSRLDPMGSVYRPSASAIQPGHVRTSAPGCRIQVVQPSRFLPFQRGVQPVWACVVVTPSKAATRRQRPDMHGGISGRDYTRKSGRDTSLRKSVPTTFSHLQCRVPVAHLLSAGEAFEDLVFVGLERLPAAGEEVRTNTFTTSIGGGAPDYGRRGRAAGPSRLARQRPVR